VVIALAEKRVLFLFNQVTCEAVASSHYQLAFCTSTDASLI